MPLYDWWRSNQTISFPDDKKTADSILLSFQRHAQQPKKDTVKTDSVTLSPFNPNEYNTAQWEALGLPKYVATRIQNFVSHKGVFRVKKDVLKIYGFDSALYQKIYPFLLLPDSVEKTKPTSRFVKEEKRPTPSVRLNINTADSAQFVRVRGIGETLAGRIVKYRNRLGGFISLNQLTEVYGLDSMRVLAMSSELFMDKNFQPQLISINQTDEKTLAAHPYIRFSNAKKIIRYRNQHSVFQDLNELYNIQSMTKKEIDKMLPYLKL